MTQSTKQKVVMVDGKCQCCPYGYHVDIDFMNFCDTVSNQSYLKQLERIQREKRKLRKSMEVYLQDQQMTEGRSTMVNPMEAHGHYRETTTNRLLDEIDSSVDQTLTSIETMMSQSQESKRYTDSGTATMQREKPKKFNTFPKKVGKQVAQELQSYNETFTATLNNRVDSNGSLSSVSTTASERQYPPVCRPYTGGHTEETVRTHTSHMTTEQIAETFALLVPGEESTAPSSGISRDQLERVREAMAASLQRVKELEEQASAVPVLQVRLAVLKEEKRLLGLQLEDARRQPPPSPRSPPPPTPPKPRVKMAAVGNHNVHEPYVLQPHLEDSTHVYQRDTIIIDRAQRQQTTLTPEPKPLTRTVGVGEGNVLDDSLHIHEKELRTVIIGQGISAGKRNVGINCRAPTRDVGVSYNFDSVEKPATRSVGITTELTPVTTNVSFKSEEFTSALRTALARSVRSMAVQVDSRSSYAHVGIQSEMSVWNQRSVGVGDCSVDVEVRLPVAHRSVSVDAFPDRMNRAVNTDYGWKLDSATNTVAQFTNHFGTQTEDKRLFNAFTNTERQQNYQASCQTDTMVFAALDQIRTTGTSTETVLTYNTGMNTTFTPVFDKAINTQNYSNTTNSGMNTESPRVKNIGVSDDRIDSFVCDLEEDKNSEEEYRFDEESIETKTTYYTTAADQKDTKQDKGYEIKREYATDKNSQSTDSYSTDVSSYTTTTSSQAAQLKKQPSEEEEQMEVLEEKVWRTNGDGQFTVTTVTTRRMLGKGKHADVKTETKTLTGGPEILGADADRIMEECRKGRRSGGSLGDLFQGQTVTTLDLKQGEGATALERVLGKEAYQQYLEELRTIDEMRAAEEAQAEQQRSSSTSHTSYTMVQDDSGLTGQEAFTRSFDSGLSTGSASSSSEIITMTTSSSSQLSDSSSPSGTLKSIMKKSTSDPGGSQKRGITFADSVIGG